MLKWKILSLLQLLCYKIPKFYAFGITIKQVLQRFWLLKKNRNYISTYFIYFFTSWFLNYFV